MSGFVSPEQLAALTGYVRPSAQARALRALGIEPFVSARGEVFVTWDIVEEAQRRRSGMEARAAQRRGPRPNLKAVT